ncbi:hypothetical protein SAMN06265379_10895 [Saccharicrinis carchari]|uniref:Uncharacterized protein n=1 Tax=Saccharicrinis carchari TaxID=1168039 RepID=A0A521EBE2_SACCC|nr:hypothetical protein [Saccharicrinis carchari]SMO81264.1 hypothetical protein SAMN06265379_10895 [Saccharicrinis carchari]
MATQTNNEGKEKLKGGFVNLLKKIGGVIEDAASLEVTTFTGNFEYKISDVVKNDVNKVRIENVLKSLTVHNQSNLNLVAYTNVKIDSDVSTIVKSDLSPADEELLKLHKDMLSSSKEARESVIKLVMDLVR